MLCIFVTLGHRCENPQWSKRDSQTRLGSPSFFTASNEQGCLSQCASMPNCLGVDVDYMKTPVECWPHTNRDDYRDDNLWSQPGTNTYELLGCNDTAVTSPTTATTATATTSATTQTTTAATTTMSTATSPSTATVTTPSPATTTVSGTLHRFLRCPIRRAYNM